MRIKGLLWLDEIVDKLHYKHNVTQLEVREVLIGKPLFRFMEKGHRPNENVYLALGQTEAGRYLIVIFILKHDQRAFILSARDMTRSERKQYGRK
ncbi:MAG: BrnT family toxin [Chloroflexi bacterium]|nr:BrnT family toxin [Chloroflexota bacterium]